MFVNNGNAYRIIIINIYTIHACMHSGKKNPLEIWNSIEINFGIIYAMKSQCIICYGAFVYVQKTQWLEKMRERKNRIIWNWMAKIERNNVNRTMENWTQAWIISKWILIQILRYACACAHEDGNIRVKNRDHNTLMIAWRKPWHWIEKRAPVIVLKTNAI